MTDSLPQSALRKWRAHFSHPVTLVSVLGIATVLALAGPFETGTLLSLPARWLYWAVLVTLCYSVGHICADMIEPAMTGRPTWLSILAIGLVTGVGVSVVVSLQNLVVFGWFPGLADLPAFFATVMAVSIVVSLMLNVVGRHLAAKNRPVEAAPPSLLTRLPLEKRGGLVALSVEDHYVRVRTTKGEEMILMRLSDAIREVGDTAGLQVHRSHWVAIDHVTAARREGDRAILTMRHGDEIPVSRANIAQIKEAGLLPR